MSDARRLLCLMRKLAEFEGYADRFAVRESDLIERGLAVSGEPQFSAWVAEHNGVPQGYAVAYSIPFTFDLRPTVVLKELFVEDEMRGQGCGGHLFAAVVEHARSINAGLLRWQVLPGNESAKGFYRERGGRVDADWESWVRRID